MFWIFIVLTIATFLAALFSFYYPFLAFLALFFIHVFAHTGHAIYLKRYTPGVITSIILVLPYCLYTYYRLLEGSLITIGDIYWSSVGMLVGAPFLFIHLVRRRNVINK